MMTDTTTPRVIDLDGHVIEPWDLWTETIEEPYRHCAPRMVQDSWGIPRLMAESRLYPTPEGPGRAPRVAMSPERLADYQHHLQGGRDPHFRLRVMDDEGIDAVLLMPSQAMVVGAIRDPGLAAATARAYNTWLAGYCRADPERLLGAALLPVQDMAASVAELRRCVEEFGFRAAFVRPNPVNGVTPGDGAYDPLYAEIERLGVLLQIHEGCGFSPGATAAIDRFESGFFSHMISHPFEQMLASLAIICGGALERFPGLRVAFMEAGAAWMPYWMARMDQHYALLRWEVPWLKMEPSAYFRRQCAVGCEVDEPGLPTTVEYCGEDSIVFSTDYPHSDCFFPGAVAAVLAREGLSDTARRKILGGNAERLLDLPAREARAAATAAQRG